MDHLGEMSAPFAVTEEADSCGNCRIQTQRGEFPKVQHTAIKAVCQDLFSGGFEAHSERMSQKHITQYAFITGSDGGSSNLMPQ